MAGSINKVIIVGRLGKDPEMRFTTSGKAVTNFSVATSERFKDQSGEMQEATEWHRIVTWGKLAENCARLLMKGSLVYLEGKIQTRSWDDKDGNKRYTTEIVAQVMQLLGGGVKQEGGEEQSGETPAFDDVPF